MSHPLMLAYLYFYVPHGPGPWASPDAGRCGSARQAFHLPVAQTMGSFQTHLSDDGRPILSPVKTISFRVGNIVRLACSPDGEKAVVVMSSYPDGQFTAWLVDLSSQHMIKLKGHSGSITSVAFSPDGAILATGSRDATVKTWSSANGRLLHTYRGHSDTINDVSFDYSGTLLASGSYDKTVLIWEVKSGSILYRLSYNENVGSVDISSTASNILTGRFNVVPVMRNYITRQVVQRFVGHTLPTTAVALSGDSKLVATTSRDGTTRLYDTSSGQSFRVLRGLSV